MAKIRVLIAEGNEKLDRDKITQFVGCAPSEMFDRVLRSVRPDIDTEIFLPTDAANHPINELSAYDGILFTGSNSNIYKMTAGTRRQIEFATLAFQSGTPMLGVCWGLQLGTVAAGGEVTPSQALDCRCEVPFSPGIALTDAGRSHAFHDGRGISFDAFGYHSDQVSKIPDNCTITARNERFIQALEIRGPKSIFWGIQYHPELTGPSAAGFMRGYARELVGSGVYHSLQDVVSVTKALDRFVPGVKTRAPDAAILNMRDSSQFEFRPLEIMNWVENLVITTKSSRT